MTSVADLPASFTPEDPLCNPQGNGAWTAEYDANSGRQALSWWGPFADRLAFVQKALFNQETLTLPNNLGSITRVVPLECPYDPSLAAQRVSMRAVTAEDDWAAGADPWKDIIATVQFAYLPYPTGGSNPFISIRQRSEPKRFTIPNYAYVLVNDSNVLVEAVAQDVGVPIAEEEITVTWHELTDLATFNGTVSPLIETVNSVPVTLPDIGLICPVGTLYVAGRTAGKTIEYGNLSKAEASVTLLYRALPWNRAIGSNGVPRWIAPSGNLTGRPFAQANPAPLWSYF